MSIPRIRNALVIFKEEVKPHLVFAHGPNPHFITKLKQNRLTDHEKALVAVLRELKRHEIPHQIISRRTLKKVHGFDLIISVGGDGTFLDASHYANPRQILLGVNSHPQLSHGAFCLAHEKNFESVFSSLLKTGKPLLHLHRLEVKMNGRKISHLALNDVLFANRSPAGTSRYQLFIGSKKETQKSSGIWISTAAGSTAAIRSAGGKPFHKGSKNIQFVVREPFHDGKKIVHLTSGLLSFPKKIKIISQMSQACLFIDGPHLAFPIKRGEKIEIRCSSSPLRAVLRA